MTVFHDEIEIEDFEWVELSGPEAEDAGGGYYEYPCPCGDTFRITLRELEDGEDVARCPSCSLLIRVIYDADDFLPS
ncbi:hypothetical protein H696_00471 [Fonticula alba]|uniref:Diphthamide biosynthesis protein 3 n=1 Tax=Fonticula alba TaxID=691883 RepID=A0A058ZG22_FONAL|nr:hypothetical protein H696_00471 [Fonticula alba]KCV72901.1 hypothetical protein H696_00471 [Fonticula alba]|eukprot:XP_009492602.1 hypothetical protein H696_00471 [Fonticula alba]